MNPLLIAEALRKRRLELGLSLSQLARRANTSAATLSRYEHGWRRFEVYTLEKLAAALDCQVRVELEPRVSAAPKSGSRQAVVRRLGRLFWDRRLQTRHIDEYPGWVVQRILEYGTLDDVHDIVQLLGRQRFLEEVAKVRFSSAKTASLWRDMLRKEGVACMQKSSRAKARNSWPS